MRFYLGFLPAFCVACASNHGLSGLQGRHIAVADTSVASTVASAKIPALVAPIPYLPKPAALPRFSVVVNQQPVGVLLNALARDAKINLDVHPGVNGVVSVNAIEQTLPQILTRVAQQIDIRWQLDGGVLSVMPDAPYLKTYHVDYFNLARNMKASVTILNSVTTSSASNNANSSTTAIDSENQNQFWLRLERNLKDMLGVKDGAAQPPSIVQPVMNALSQQANLASKTSDAKATLAMVEGLAKLEKTVNQAEAAKPVALQPVVGNGEGNLVILNPESGTISVRASQKNQRKVAEFLAAVQSAAQRQVMIEATIVEVALSDQYQAGVDWSRIASGSGWSIGQSLLGANLAAAPVSVLSYSGTNFNATIKLLEQFGRTRVLSSPKVIALNNQTAVMKVVEEQVYFTLQLDEDKNTDGVITGRTYTSTLHTVPVGLVMQVTPQISELGSVAMNVRPTITNISAYAEDPAVALMSRDADKPVQSLIPILQVREFDSTLKIASGQAAVLGGLIQDKQVNSRQGVPGLSRLPLLGDVFSYRDDKVSKIELVVFLRPIIVRENGVNGELAAYQQFLPDEHFFDASRDQALSAFQSGRVVLP